MCNIVSVVVDIRVYEYSKRQDDEPIYKVTKNDNTVRMHECL